MIQSIGMVCEGKLLKADSRACVEVGNDSSEWFPVNVGFRWGCRMSPWFFNVYMDGVVREVNVRALGKGLELLSANSSRFEIKQPFADDIALVTDSEEKLSWLVSEFGRISKRRKLRVNVGKRKVMRRLGYGNGGQIHVILNSEPLQE